MNKNLCVYLGANTPPNTHYTDASKTLGVLLKQHHLNLIYGGAKRGLMGILADSALNAGVHTTGVMSDDLLGIEEIHPDIDTLINTKTINLRKEKMIELSEYFIMLPGGVGTCEELFNTWCHIKITGSKKKIGLLNIDGFYDPLLVLIDNMLKNTFINESHRAMIYSHTDVNSLLKLLLNQHPN